MRLVDRVRRLKSELDNSSTFGSKEWLFINLILVEFERLQRRLDRYSSFVIREFSLPELNGESSSFFEEITAKILWEGASNIHKDDLARFSELAVIELNRLNEINQDLNMSTGDFDWIESKLDEMIEQLVEKRSEENGKQQEVS